MKYTNTVTNTALKIVGLIFSSVMLFFVFAHSAHAVALSKGAVLELNDSAAIFLIQFTLGSENGDMLVPATTLRSTDDELDTSFSHYYIEDQTGDVVEDGTASAILLSNNAPLDGAQYRVPQGETAVFTLLTLFVTEEEDPAFRARLRTLPFHIDGHLMNQQYNQHELTKFVSASTALNVD